MGRIARFNRNSAVHRRCAGAARTPRNLAAHAGLQRCQGLAGAHRLQCIAWKTPRVQLLRIAASITWIRLSPGA